MAYSPIEDKYLSVLTSQQFPDMPAEPVATQPSVDGVQLAMGGSGAGKGRTNAPMSDVATGLFDMGAATVKGAAQGFAGLPGDLEGIGRLLLDKMGVAVSQDTVLPKTDDIKKWLDQNVGQVGTGKNPYESIGEVTAPGGQIKAVKAAGRGAKALAPKAGEMVLDTMTKLGTPVKMGVVPESPSMAAKPAAPVNDLGFYSAVEQAAMNVQRKSGSGQAFLNDITKGENVKADEVKWIGLDEFLKGKKSVTKQEVQDYIAANKVDVQEVQLGAGTVKSFEQWASDQGLSADAIRDFGPTLRNSYEAFKNNASQKVAAAKFGQYTLPGGENYREILLTLPEKEPRNLNDIAQQMYGKRFSELGDDEANSVTRAEREEIKAGNFKSSHWNEKNVLAHIRVNDRVDADGKKMLLVEEVQSDWHQAGRDKGYKNEAELEAKFAPLAQEHRAIVERRADIVAKPGMEEEYKSLAKREQQLIDEMNKLHDTKQYGVPDAPMKDTWYQLALKRVLKYAADNGYERVGLTTGSRQAERFDLSKQLDAVEYKRDPNGGGTIIADDKSGKTVMQQRIGSDNDLADYIGKEAAKKLLSQEPMQNTGTDAVSYVLNNADLQVGGEGMKKYYDEIYPTYLQKYGKKWGAKVGETTVNVATEDKMVAKLRDRGYDPETVTLQEILSDSGGRTPSWLTEDDVLMLELGVDLTSKGVNKEPVRFVDITPEMRKSVGKGQPLFSATAAGAGAAATMQDKENK